MFPRHTSPTTKDKVSVTPEEVLSKWRCDTSEEGRVLKEIGYRQEKDKASVNVLARGHDRCNGIDCWTILIAFPQNDSNVGAYYYLSIINDATWAVATHSEESGGEYNLFAHADGDIDIEREVFVTAGSSENNDFEPLRKLEVESRWECNELTEPSIFHHDHFGTNKREANRSIGISTHWNAYRSDDVPLPARSGALGRLSEERMRMDSVYDRSGFPRQVAYRVGDDSDIGLRDDALCATDNTGGDGCKVFQPEKGRDLHCGSNN
ncbi:hypothetical protein IW261DRAFT_1417512 [Armillaria novae-zelandiae]|uniref:Uncharacterized protein n=1 Tax=Armillaria novae-zelandiae TaxID=153914 RepID=A0AA39PGC2_9AGAR|nr:hypothetical protein IW261DRAFT_1417512 [Armillaria novae-zelandiae]